MPVVERSMRFAGGAVLVLMVLVSGCSGRSGGASATTVTSGTALTDGSGSNPDSSAAGAPAPTTACASRIVTDEIRTALVQANGLPGGQAIPGSTYYGVCGSTSYAVARFEPAPRATAEERVSFQDDGRDIRFFTKRGAGTWVAVGGVPYDQSPTCAPFAELPAALKAQWDNCPLA